MRGLSWALNVVVEDLFDATSSEFDGELATVDRQ